MATPPLPRLPVSERLRRAGIAAWSIIGLLIVGAIVVWVLGKISVIFPPLVLAILIIYLLNPLVSRLERRGVSRGLGTLCAYVVMVGVIAILVVTITPFVSNQVESFGEDWPQLQVEVGESIENAAARVEDRLGFAIDTSQVTCLLHADESADVDVPTAERCDEVTRQFRQRLADSADRITEIGSSVLEVLLIFVLGPLLALYLLVDLPRLQRDVLALVPSSHREEVADLGSKIGNTVGGFFRGQLVVALIVGVMASAGFGFIGLRFWLVIGAVAGFTNLIPLVGPFIGGGLGFVVGTLTDGFGMGLKAAIVALVVQQIDNHLISPNVMKRTVQLHPVTVMLSLLAGGAVAGFWGVLLGVPAVAVAKLLLTHLWTTRVLGHEADLGAEPPSVVPSKETEEHVEEVLDEAGEGSDDPERPDRRALDDR